jgi:hypothetical protein
MRSSFPRLLAATVLSISAIFTGLIALGLAAADAVIATDRFPVSPADRLALDQFASVAPILAVFAFASLAAAIALALAASWSRRLAIGVSSTGFLLGVVALAAVLLAQGPFAVLPSDRVLDGIEVVGTFTVIQLVALIASILDGSPRRAVATGAAAAA